MAVQDILNNGAYNFKLPTQEDYQPDQFNAKGDSLSPTPTGAPISVDADNDQRNSQQFKRDALQAQQDTAAAYDTSNKIVGSTGYQYEKIDDTRAGQARSAAMAFAEGYLSHMGDQGAATAAGALGASQAVSNHSGALKRQSLIQDLESKGYNPIDIDKWIQTGDTKDLVVNKGSWTSDGNGYMHNTLTGEIKQMPGYNQTKPQQLHYLKNPDGTYTAVDPTTNQVIGGNVGQAKPATDNGGDIGLDDLDDNPAFKDDGNGGVLKLDGYDKNHNPKYVAASAKESDAFRNRGTAAAPDATQVQQTQNIDTLLNATDNQIEGFTGRADQLAQLDSNYITLQTPEDDRKYLAAAKEIEGYMQNQGVGAAKSMGLSGINTLEEAQRAFKSMPQLDRSSPKAFRDSVQRIKDYVTNYNNQKHPNSTGSKKSSKDMTDDELINLYGG